MTKKQLLYLWQYFLSGGGGTVASDLVMRPNFNDMANLSLTSPSNGSATFNGTSDYVQIPNALLSGTQDFTISAWVYQTAQGANAVISSYGSGNTGGFELLYFGGNMVMYIGGPVNAPFNFLNTWKHVTATRESGSVKIYIDGSLITTATNATSIATSANARIGSTSSGGEWWSGNLANVAVWNRALTSDEINSIQWKRYDLLTAGESTGLVAWYALDDITGTSVPDSTGTYNATAY